MKFSTFLRHVREGVKSVFRNGWMSFASISSIFISLFVLGVFVLLTLNVNHIAGQVEDQVQIRVYLNLEVKEDQVQALQSKIGNMPEVSKIQFISKEEGLEMLRNGMGPDNAAILEGLDGEFNPLPYSFTVEVYDPRVVDAVAAQIKAFNESDESHPIDDVNYKKDTIDMLLKVTNIVRNSGFIVVVGLAVTALFLISNTIKMTIVARKREIGIMKLVGATNAFIRWPFFIEGALIGLFSSMLTAGALLYGYYELLKLSQLEFAALMLHLVPLSQAWQPIVVLLVGLGTIIGMWGTTISVRKYLKI